MERYGGAVPMASAAGQFLRVAVAVRSGDGDEVLCPAALLTVANAVMYLTPLVTSTEAVLSDARAWAVENTAAAEGAPPLATVPGDSSLFIPFKRVVMHAQMAADGAVAHETLYLQLDPPPPPPCLMVADDDDASDGVARDTAREEGRSPAAAFGSAELAALLAADEMRVSATDGDTTVTALWDIFSEAAAHAGDDDDDGDAGNGWVCAADPAQSRKRDRNRDTEEGSE
jgi:hypothetical protein